jgi:hypothetical protein
MENKDVWDLHSDKIQSFFDSVIKTVFPNSRFRNTQSIGSPSIAPNFFNGTISPENLFIGTKYEPPNDSLLIHFTNIFGLLSILKSGYFRMSEFINFEDKSEFIYSSSILNHQPFSYLSDSDLDNLKKDLFAISSCLSNEKTKRNHFMWDKYANNGKGVCIEFDIKLNNPQYTLGKILYGSENLDIIDQLKNLTELFMKENANFSVSNYIQFFSTVLSFHKSKKYSLEDEVRLFYLKDKSINDINYFQDLNSNSIMTDFIKIYHDISKHPFYNNENSDLPYFNSIPRIEIKNIILGYNLTYDQIKSIKVKLDEIKKEFDYKFRVSQINEEEEINDITNLPIFY